MPGGLLIRKLIRDNLRLLLMGNTDAGDSVFVARANKAFIEELPGIFIYTISDNPVITRRHDQNFDRKVLVVIEIIVPEKNKSQTIQDEGDIIAGQVEDLLLPNMHLQNPPPWESNPGEKIVSYIQLGETSISKTDDIQEDLSGLVLEFEVEYPYCKEILSNLDDFKRFESKFKKGIETPSRLVEIPEP